MGNKNGILKNKGKGYYVYLLSCILGIIMAFSYGTRGGDALTPFEKEVVILAAVGAVINVLMLVKPVTPLEIIPFVFYLSALFTFIGREVNFIGNVIYGVDGNAFDTGFFMVIITGILAAVTGMAACIMEVKKEQND